jgi:hypothetical protein
MLNEKSQKILNSAGWRKERKIEIQEVVNLLQERGFLVNQVIIDFLKEYGMLEIRYEKDWISKEVIKKYNLNHEECHHTNPIKALGDGGDSRIVVPFEEYAGERLTVIGEISNRTMMLMISETGKLYCDSGKYGDTIIESLNKIFSNESCTSWNDIRK